MYTEVTPVVASYLLRPFGRFGIILRAVCKSHEKMTMRITKRGGVCMCPWGRGQGRRCCRASLGRHPLA